MPKVLPLLVYLALNRGASLRREAVAFALWPDDSEIDAREPRDLPRLVAEPPDFLRQARTALNVKPARAR